MWLEPPDTPIPEALASAVGGHPLVARSLARRGVLDPSAAQAFLDPAYYKPADPLELPGMAQAADRIQAAVRSGERILVWGDFDVDGQTATALLVLSLRGLGAQVDYHVPVRRRESHGVSLPVLRGYLEGKNPISLLLTCDTGIAAHEAADFAQRGGVDVIITDHHELPPSLPAARAILTPRLLPASHPLATLPGVGVAYKLAEELYRRSGRLEECQGFNDLVALGIVADVAAQTGDARYLLQRGLALLRQTPRPGLQAIYERAELDPGHLNEEHIGFVIAPRLNALGRLGDANPAVELLTTRDLGQARLLALQLEGLNARRQLLTSQVLRGALAQIEQERSLLDSPVLVLAHPGWEAGVIGIVAGRLAERFGRPAVLISLPGRAVGAGLVPEMPLEGQTPPDLPLQSAGRGSARSVEGVDITATLRAVAASPASPLLGYGGHAMAAGFSIDPARIDDFRRLLSRAADAQNPERGAAQPRDAGPSLTIDAYLELADLTPDLVADLSRLAPFGPGNPPLVLASRDLRLASHAQVGREGEHLLMTVEDPRGETQKVMWWGGADYLGLAELPDGLFDLAYIARLGTYRGQPGLQLEWLGYRQEKREVTPARQAPEVLDYRQEVDPQAVLSVLLDEAAETGATVQVWAEGPDLPAIPSFEDALRRRDQLSGCETLVVWTSPPGGAELRAALAQARPRRVALFAVDPGLDSPEPFLQRLAGLAKYALQKEGGRFSLSRLAAALAAREAAVRLGLEWLTAQGYMRIVNVDETEVVLEASGEPDFSAAARRLAGLGDLLRETRAYHAYFSRAESSALASEGW